MFQRAHDEDPRRQPTDSVLPATEVKAAYVQRMFAAIAHRYDVMNRLMTGGRDQVWRRYVIRQCALPAGGSLLDVATGTGDIAYEARRLHPDAHIVGLDFTYEMMVAGQYKNSGQKLPFLGGDALRLPFSDNTFDAVASGFMMRNVISIPQALREQLRVLKPGGRCVCLEIAKPDAPVLRELFHLYFYRVVPHVGGLISGSRDAYTYLPQSLSVFLTPPELARLMRDIGFRNVHYRTLGLGAVAVHVGAKL